MKKIKKRLQELKPKHILDVGTGAGNFIYRLNEIYKAKYYGIDSSEKAIESARSHFEGDDFIFEVMDAEKMKYDDETFDLVCLSNTIHHLADLTPIFTEMLRVLKPGGHILINEMQSDNLHPMQVSHRLIHHFAAKIDRLFGVEHNDTLTKNEIISLLEPWGELEDISEKPVLKDSMTEEEFEWYKRLITRVVDRAKELKQYQELKKEADELVAYVEKHGYDNATSVTVLIKK